MTPFNCSTFCHCCLWLIVIQYGFFRCWRPYGPLQLLTLSSFGLCWVIISLKIISHLFIIFCCLNKQVRVNAIFDTNYLKRGLKQGFVPGPLFLILYIVLYITLLMYLFISKTHLKMYIQLVVVCTLNAMIYTNEQILTFNKKSFW